MRLRLLSIVMLLLGIAAGAEAGNLTIGSTTLDVGNYYTEWSGMTCLWEGTITFTDANHVTFENVTLNFNTANSTAISTDIPNLTITLVGENKIQGDGTKKGIYFSQYMTINGDGSLDIVANENGIEGTGGNTLTITDAHVKAKGGTYGIRLGSSSLIVKGNGVFEAYGGTKCLQGVKSLGEGNTVVTPSGAKFLSSALSVVDASNNPISGEWVTILRGIVIDETNFPDENFREWLLEQEYGKDGGLTEKEIEGVTTMNVSEKNIESLQGIEFFTALTYLDCNNNQLTSLDVSKNTALESLRCIKNQLNALNVSSHTALEYLYCNNNQLTVLDVSKNTALKILGCDDNQLTTLDVSNNTELQALACSNNQLTTLDVSSNTTLNYLYCYNNQLTALNVSNNTKLFNLYCYNNQLTTLDVSNCTSLWALDCYGNKLRGDGMATLVNSLPTFYDGYLHVYDSKTDNHYSGNVMTKEQVAEVKNTKRWKVLMHDGSDWVDYTGEIAIDETNFPDENFRDCIIEQVIDLNGYLSDKEIAAVTSMNVSSKEIKSLKGIEFFTELTSLYCLDNQLISLDVSGNTKLGTLDCTYNSLTTLDVSKNTELIYLHCYGNAISGEGMDALVNSLPPIDDDHALKVLYVHSFDEEDRSYTTNKMTTQQVAAAKEKGWKVVKILEGEFLDYEGVSSEKGDVNEDRKVDAKDVVDLINYLRGELAGDKNQFDVNEDGKVNTADVIYIVNILTK